MNRGLPPPQELPRGCPVSSSSRAKTSTFYDVTAVRTGVLDYLKKGQGVIVSGHLSVSFVEKDGKTFTNIDVVARDLELTGQPRGNS